MTGEDFLTQLENAISYANQESFNIRFSDKGGKISPSGDQPCRITDNITLIFTEDREKCFICWQVLQDGQVLPTEEASIYITFEDSKSPETKLTVNGRAENLTVQAKVVNRPVIVQTSPQSKDSGVPCDYTIVVMFDKEIDESSIYWTKSELEELGVYARNEVPIPAEGKNDCYYAYWDGHDKNSYCYKNIKISNYDNENVNYLSYFGEPKLDNTNKKVLRIRVNKGPDGNNKIKPQTELLITLDKSFSYYYEDEEIKKFIGLAEDYRWTYLTNDTTDNIAPEFVDYEQSEQYGFIVTTADDNQTQFDSSKACWTTLDAVNTWLTTNNPGNTDEKIKELVKKNVKNKKLWVRGSFKDNQDGSGPASLTWKLYKVKGTNYADIAEGDPIGNEGEVLDLNIKGITASINKNINDDGFDMGGTIIDLKDYLPDGEEGVYRIDFVATDNSEKKSAVKSFYFFYDAYCNSINDTFVLKPYRTTSIIKGYIKNETTHHWSHAKTEVNGVELNYGDEKEFSNMKQKDKKNVTVTVKETDIFGNTVSMNIDVLISPMIGMIYYTDGWWSFEYESNRTPSGIICKVENSDYVRIVEINPRTDKYNKFTVSQLMVGKDYDDGLKNTEYMTGTAWEAFKDWFNKINFVKGDIWYLPSDDEFTNLYNNKDIINETLEKIPNSTDSVLKVGDYITSNCCPGAGVYYQNIFKVNENSCLIDKVKYSASNQCYCLLMARVPW